MVEDLMNYNVLLVSKALDTLSKESDEDSFDSAQVVINAFHSLEPPSQVATRPNHPGEDQSALSQTFHEDVIFKDDGDRVATVVRGVRYVKVGTWKVWREIDPKNKKVSRIWFTHYLLQGLNAGVRNREFFVEYDQYLTPRGFAYVDEPIRVFKLAFFALYRKNIVVRLGRVRNPDEGLRFTTRN